MLNKPKTRSSLYRQDISKLEADPESIARLLALYYVLFTRPSPAWGLFDFYVGQPIDGLLSRKWKVEDFTLRGKLGGGNYGVTYEVRFPSSL